MEFYFSLFFSPPITFPHVFLIFLFFSFLFLPSLPLFSNPASASLCITLSFLLSLCTVSLFLYLSICLALFKKKKKKKNIYIYIYVYPDKLFLLHISTKCDDLFLGIEQYNSYTHGGVHVLVTTIRTLPVAQYISLFPVYIGSTAFLVCCLRTRGSYW